ncbi:MAG: DEAD/DEAH box helicase [Kofleriaceae bacterium]|nr:DEAD/DEAH box helicase [Kofleriaceae bacterium]
MTSAASLAKFAAPVQRWFELTFGTPTAAQTTAWPLINAGEHTLLVAPTGSGKTLAAFLVAIDRLMFGPRPAPSAAIVRTRRSASAGTGTRVLYISPIKALAVDVERNLLMPLEQIAAQAAAHQLPASPVTVAVRTGDTTAKVRRMIARGGADILITTPESLYLMLTSNARSALMTVDTVIIDEIHALVPTERGAHLALSLERLEHLTGRPVQRIGLSATQRPLEEVAQFLGGGRTVRIANAEAQKVLDVRVEMPSIKRTNVATQLTAAVTPPVATAVATATAPSHWDHIYPRLLELITSHRSTLIFVNSRRLAERMAQAINVLAQATVIFAHHGSVAKETRAEIEAQLKAGTLRGLIATNTLELGIDMGAIDLVVQVDAAPSIASGLQRIGRAGHQVGATSQGIVMPKFRGDLVACATLVQAMRAGEIESIRYLRNPLDVLAQQLVAMVSLENWHVDTLFQTVTACASFAELPRAHFDATIDMLSGCYALEELADTRPRMTYNRSTGIVQAREGAKRVAIANAGTIPDRGLFAVYLANAAAGKGRIGELDEEMVFESKVGDRFTLGASTWRIEAITFDRVIVTPAPGEPGRMPFWRGENAMRPIEFGQRMGVTLGRLTELTGDAARAYAQADLQLDASVADALIEYVNEQAARSAVPTDRRIVVEPSRDEFGDWRICVLSPLGAKVLAPWAIVAQAQGRAALGVDLDVLWTNDGFVVRVPAGTAMLDADLAAGLVPAWLLPKPDGVIDQLTGILAESSIFAARFREAASRALLLPRKLPGQRTPLWQIRKKSQDLLRGAQRIVDFPILVETYRKCLTDVFDTAALRRLLSEIADGTINVTLRPVATPSPFANALLFGYVAAFMYEGDAPAAERRAQALAIDPNRLRELMGELDLRTLLSAEVIDAVMRMVQQRDRVPVTLDATHDLLLRLGDQSAAELATRSPAIVGLAEQLVALGRVHTFDIDGVQFFVPIEYAMRYHHAIAAALPRQRLGAMAMPTTVTTAVAQRRDVVVRFAKTHGPFTECEVTTRYGLRGDVVSALLAQLVSSGDLVNGNFRPDDAAPAWVHVDVLRTLRLRSLAAVRAQISAVAPEVLVRFTHAWHGVARRRTGLDAVLDAVEKLQGMPILASQLESEILPARIDKYLPSDLDTLAAAGEITWHGLSASGNRDGKIALYLADQASRFSDAAQLASATAELDAVQLQIIDVLRNRGALFLSQLREALRIFPGDISKALWTLTWRGLVSNDSFAPLRQLAAVAATTRRARRTAPHSFRSRRSAPLQAEGRWRLLVGGAAPTVTEQVNAWARQWLTRYGVVTKEVAMLENVSGGFATLYPVLRALEDSGQIRRGHFVRDIAAVQFALPHALDQLRTFITPPPEPIVTTLAATDCANPYGCTLPWPTVRIPDGMHPNAGRRAPGRVANVRAPDGMHPVGSMHEPHGMPDPDHPDGMPRKAEGTARRSAGAVMITIDGRAAAWVARGMSNILTWEAAATTRNRDANLVANEIGRLARANLLRGAPCNIATINGGPAPSDELAPYLRSAGFIESGGQLRVARH